MEHFGDVFWGCTQLLAFRDVHEVLKQVMQLQMCCCWSQITFQEHLSAKKTILIDLVSAHLTDFRNCFSETNPYFEVWQTKKQDLLTFKLEKIVTQKKSVQPNKRFHTPKTQKKNNNIKLNWVKICNTKNGGDPKNVASFTASSNEFAPASKGGYGPFVNCHGFTPRHLWQLRKKLKGSSKCENPKKKTQIFLGWVVGWLLLD